MLERWLAHHVAELIIGAENATGPAKFDAEARAAGLILRLWARRRELPAAADPLGSYREAIAVLSHLMPESNPWAVYARRGGTEQVFLELFDCMASVVVRGLLLTATSPPRRVALAEAAAMEREELALREHLDWWEAALTPAIPSTLSGFFDSVDDSAILAPGSPEEGATPTDAVPAPTAAQPPEPSIPDWGEDEPTEEGTYGADDASNADDAGGDLIELRLRAHAAVTAELERLQKALATLVERWRAEPPMSA